MVPEFTQLAQEAILIDGHFEQQHLRLSGSAASGYKLARLCSLFPRMSQQAVQQQCATLDQLIAYGERLQVFGSISDCLPTNLSAQSGCVAHWTPLLLNIVKELPNVQLNQCVHVQCAVWDQTTFYLCLRC